MTCDMSLGVLIKHISKNPKLACNQSPSHNLFIGYQIKKNYGGNSSLATTFIISVLFWVCLDNYWHGLSNRYDIS